MRFALSPPTRNAVKATGMRADIFLFLRSLLGGLILSSLLFGPAQAAKLWQLLERAQKNCATIEQSIAKAGLLSTSAHTPDGSCLGGVTHLYLDALSDREQLQTLQDAITSQRGLLDIIQEGLEGGRLPYADSLLAEIELKRLQLLETERVTKSRLARLFFESNLDADPAAFIAPIIPDEAWPEDEAAALSALAANASNAPGRQGALKLAWTVYEDTKRRRSLLQPMTAFTRDLAHIARQMFDIGQLNLLRLSELSRDAILQQLTLQDAERDLLAARLRVLEILGRTSMIE